jgi:tRNA (guanine37-N1)-methyltransferase
LQFAVISVVPEILQGLSYGIVGRAVASKLIELHIINPRDFSHNTYRRVDDRPYGGGSGMLLLYEPMSLAIQKAQALVNGTAKVIHLSPRGKRLKQDDFNNLVLAAQPLIFLAGHYEGIDERIAMQYVTEDWSVGDFVMSGGEFAAMVFIDTMVRLLPGSLGSAESIVDESFMTGLLEYPQYTRPENVDGLNVPEVLLSGDHARIATWRRKMSLGNTWLYRPDLLDESNLSKEDISLLLAFKREFSRSSKNE